MNNLKLQRILYFTYRSQHHKVLICGAGSGGATVARRLSATLDSKDIAIIDDAQTHYYQPMWTLVGAGIKKLSDSGKDMRSILPSGVNFINERIETIHPEENAVQLSSGNKITYDWLVISLGLRLAYEKIKGAEEALANDPRVCSNYSPKYCVKTFDAIQNLAPGGHAVFTHPNTPIKCGGAPQKIMYLTDDYLRSKDKRDDVKISFFIASPSMFAVKKYSDSLTGIADRRNIERHHCTNLIEVDHKASKAVFQCLDKDETISTTYDLLHIVPPMEPVKSVFDCTALQTPECGKYVAVDRNSTRHVKYKNVYALGDASSLPTSKTAAAVASQSAVLSHNLLNAIKGIEGKDSSYDGYTSCPLITGYHKGIIAEFIYDSKPCETLPIDQSKERMIFGEMKKYLLAPLYWKLMLRGHWPGPKYVRKLLHLGLGV